ncbi:arylesterase [Geobacter sp. DSM 9736]|uniref:arylesterase n=1 Tax=Geobacter sp. DSM 9736 TaxID=1277350 RepID=UPI000B5EEEB6|nr:arylesterase [Geobacter sp. DSM 9736]SNB45246.1 Lysophospholipase L1 [Geobacter sp. DSM 9736]
MIYFSRTRYTLVMNRLRKILVSIWLLLLVSCSDTPTLPPLPTDGAILAFGDSLTYGTGAAAGESYPEVLETLIRRRVINAGIPGETTAEGLVRLPALLEEQKPRLMVLCLGGNDFLRRMDEDQTEKNLKAMVGAARERGVPVVLLGVPKPGVFLKAHSMYCNIAGQFALPYEGKSLQRVLGDTSLKSDPIHPNAAGYRELAEAVAKVLKKSGAL